MLRDIARKIQRDIETRIQRDRDTERQRDRELQGKKLRDGGRDTCCNAMGVGRGTIFYEKSSRHNAGCFESTDMKENDVGINICNSMKSA